MILFRVRFQYFNDLTETQNSNNFLFIPINNIILYNVARYTILPFRSRLSLILLNTIITIHFFTSSPRSAHKKKKEKTITKQIYFKSRRKLKKKKNRNVRQYSLPLSGNRQNSIRKCVRGTTAVIYSYDVFPRSSVIYGDGVLFGGGPYINAVSEWTAFSRRINVPTRSVGGGKVNILLFETIITRARGLDAHTLRGTRVGKILGH